MAAGVLFPGEISLLPSVLGTLALYSDSSLAGSISITLLGLNASITNIDSSPLNTECFGTHDF